MSDSLKPRARAEVCGATKRMLLVSSLLTSLLLAALVLFTGGIEARGEEGQVRPFAVFSRQDASLTLYNNADRPREGETYDGRSVTQIFENFTQSGAGQPAWSAVNRNVKQVVAHDPVAPTSLARWFFGFTELESCDLSLVDVSQATNLSRLFSGCTKLSSVRLSGWDTSQVTSMESLFEGCSSLSELDLSGWDTTGATITSMLSGCTKLTSLQLGTNAKIMRDGGLSLDQGTWRDRLSGTRFATAQELCDFDSARTGAAWYDASSTCFSVLTDDGTLLLYDRDALPSAGDTAPDYEDEWGRAHLAERVWSGAGADFLAGGDIPWQSCADDIKRVVVMDHMTPASTASWFLESPILYSVDLTKLDTSTSKDDGNMLGSCPKLDEVTLGEQAHLGDSCGLDVTSERPWRVRGGKDSFRGLSELVRWDKKERTGIVTYELVREAFAVYSETDHSLTLYNNADTVEEGQEGGYNGREVTGVFRGYDAVTEAPVWADVKRIVSSVSVADEVRVATTKGWFDGFSALSSVNLTGLDTSRVQDMSSMFHGCKALTSTVISMLDTSCVEDMNHIFAGCTALGSLDLAGIDTSSVVDMTSMFEGCTALVALDVSGFDTSSTTKMRAMFSGCEGLTSLDFSKFDTSHVQDMAQMFDGCLSLSKIDTSGFDTARANDLSAMFRGCASLCTLDLSGFNTWGDPYAQNWVDMTDMLDGCTNLCSLTLGPDACLRDACGLLVGSDHLWCTLDHEHVFDSLESLISWDQGTQTQDRGKVAVVYRRVLHPFAVYSATDYSLTIYGNEDLLAGEVSDTPGSSYMGKEVTFLVKDYTSSDTLPNSVKGRVGSVTVVGEVFPTSIASWFAGLESLTTFSQGDLSTLLIQDLSYAFSGCASLRSLDISMFATPTATNFQGILQGCGFLESLDLSGFSAPSAKNFQDFLAGCSKLKSLDLSSFSAPSATNFQGFLRGCSKLEKMDASGLVFSQIKDASHMFSGCSSLTSVDELKMDAPLLEDASYLFADCSSLTSLGGLEFVAPVLSDASYMFSGCSSLESLDLSHLGSHNLTSTEGMFLECSALTELQLRVADESATSKMASMFYNCSSLIQINLSTFSGRLDRDLNEMFKGCNNLGELLLGEGFLLDKSCCLPFTDDYRWWHPPYPLFSQAFKSLDELLTYDASTEVPPNGRNGQAERYLRIRPDQAVETQSAATPAGALSAPSATLTDTPTMAPQPAVATASERQVASTGSGSLPATGDAVPQTASLGLMGVAVLALAYSLRAWR